MRQKREMVRGGWASAVRVEGLLGPEGAVGRVCSGSGQLPDHVFGALGLRETGGWR
jgi:hypothetical protein